MPVRSLKTEEMAKLRAAGVEVPEGTMIDDETWDIIESPLAVPPEKPQGEVLAEAVTQPEGGIPGVVGRQFASSAIPAAAGGVVGASAAGFLAGAGFGPVGAGAGALIGGGLAAFGAKKAQTAAIKAAASANPGGIWDKHQRQSEIDVARHPLISTAATLPAAVFAPGGSLLPNIAGALKNPRVAAGLAGIAGGIDVAGQLSSGAPYDPVQTAIASLGGPFFTARNATPAIASSAMSRADLDKALAAAKGAAPESIPLVERLDFDKIASTSPEGLRTIAGQGTGESNFYRVLARLKKQEIPLAVADIKRLAQEGPGRGYENVAREILEKAIPEIDITKQKLTAAEEAYQQRLARTLAESQVRQIRPVEDRITSITESGISQPASTGAAARSAEIIRPEFEARLARESEAAYQNRLAAASQASAVSRIPEAESRITSITDQGISQPPSTGQAAASAQAILAGQPRNAKAALEHFRKLEKTFNELESRAKAEPEDSPARAILDRAVAQMRMDIDAEQMRLFEPLGLGPEPPITPSAAPPAAPPIDPVPPVAPKPTVTPAAPEAPAVTPSESTSRAGRIAALLDEIKKELPASSPSQAAAARGAGSTEVNTFRSVLPGNNAISKQAQDLVLSYPAAKAKFTTRPSPEEIVKFFDSIPAADQKRLVELSDMGATGWPKPRTPKPLATPKKAQQVKVEGPADKSLPNEPRGFGLTPAVLKKANPIELVRNVVRGETSKVSTPAGRRYEKKHEAMAIEQRSLSESRYDAINKSSRGLAEESRVKVGDYLKDLDETGSSSIKLSPEEQLAVDNLRKIILETGIEKRDTGPWLYAYDLKGAPTRRPAEIKPNHFPAVKSAEVVELLANPERNPARFAQLKQDYIDYVKTKTNATPEEALDQFNLQKQVVVGPTAPNPMFRALRYEEGIGLPRSWQEPDPFKAMRRYINRHATDLAYHRQIESDPVLAKALGLDDDGKGNPIPDVVKAEDGSDVMKGELEGLASVKNALADYIGIMDPTAQKFERLQGLVHAGRIGPLSQARNIVQNLGALPEILSPSEYKYVIDGIHKMFDAGAYQDALRSGSVRSGRNILPTVANDLSDNVARLSDVVSRYTGAEALAKANDVMLDIIGRNVAKNRILNGDKEFLTKWGPPDWQKKTLDEITDYIAANFTRNFSGAYDATKLPSFVLRGSQAQFAPLLKLSRWSIERFNRWYENAYQPALKGDIKPLVSSLAGGMLATGAINMLVEELTNRKPKELKWDEWLKLGADKDTAYTVFSKAATASYGGILADLIFGGLQLSKGEIPRSYNNLLFQAASDLTTRVMQFAGALQDGSATWEDLPKLGFEVLKDQLQVVKLLDPKEDEGKREERIARRLGFMPRKPGVAGSLPNPFSQAEAYRTEDADQLSRILTRKMQTGQQISTPDPAIRTERTVGPNGLLDYYEFIRQSQGEDAAKAALERDFEATRKRLGLFSSALRR